jgi:signal transduction histidine kinase
MDAVARGAAGRARVLPVAGPLALAVFQVAGTVGASHRQAGVRPLDAGAIVLALTGPIALLWLRRFPVPVLWTVAAATLAYLLRGYAYGPVVVSLAVAVVAAIVLGHRLAAWSAVAAVYVGHFALRGAVRDEPWSWGEFFAVGAWALVVLAAGEVVRVRRERSQSARRVRAETQRRQQNEERLLIARELHDVVAHHMSLINVQAGVALHLVDRRPEQAQTALRAIKDASKEALVELRALVGVLRDESEAAPREPASMLDSLDAVIERSAYAGLTVHKTVEGQAHRLPAAVELAAFRIVQEGITNVVRHAGARSADVLLRYGPDMLTVRVDDDGSAGPRVHSLEPGSGLRGMRERAVALGGTLTVSAAPAGGVRVQAELPFGTET